MTLTLRSERWLESRNRLVVKAGLFGVPLLNCKPLQYKIRERLLKDYSDILLQYLTTYFNHEVDPNSPVVRSDVYRLLINPIKELLRIADYWDFVASRDEFLMVHLDSYLDLCGATFKRPEQLYEVVDTSGLLGMSTDYLEAQLSRSVHDAWLYIDRDQPVKLKSAILASRTTLFKAEDGIIVQPFKPGTRRRNRR